MNIQKRINKSQEYNSKKENYQNQVYNSLMNKYLKNNNLSVNAYYNKETSKKEKTYKKEIQKENNEKKEQGEEKNKCKFQDNMPPINVLNFDKISPNICYENSNSKRICKNPKTKKYMIKLKNPKMNKIKRKILTNQNSHINSNHNRFFTEDSFLSTDKDINNPLIQSKDEKIKAYIYNNDNRPKYKIRPNNDNISKLLDKDIPCSLNNSHRFINGNGENNNYFDGISPDSQDYITFKNKDFTYIEGNNKTMEAGKMKNSKKFFNANLEYKNNILNNLQFSNRDNNNNSDIKRNTRKYLNSKSQYNNINNLTSRSNLNTLENNNFLSVSDDLLSSEKPQKIFFKPKKKLDIKNLLFNSNALRNTAENNKYIYNNNKTVYSTDNKLNKRNNLLIDKSKSPLRIEKYFMSFDNSKKIFNEEKKKCNYINYFQRKKNEKIKCVKNKIIIGKNSREKKLTNDKKILINDEADYNKKDYTSYKIYKKPNLVLSQNNPINSLRGCDKDNFNSRSYFNLYKTNKKNNDRENKFYNRQNLGYIYQKRNNNYINIKTQGNIIFRKKNLSPLLKFGINAYNTYSSPIYSKKKPSPINKNNNNNIEHNTLSNTYFQINDIEKNNKVYTKERNSYNNTTYKFFNTQIINFRNNLFNKNDQLYRSDYMNTSPFGEEMEFEHIQPIRTKVKSPLNPTNNNSQSFSKKYNYKKLIFFNKTFTKIEKVMKKYIMPVSYISKSNVKIYQIPKRKNSYFSKVHLSNKDKVNEEKKIADNINEKKYIKKKIIIFRKNKDKYLIKKNTDNKLEYNIKTIKNEEIDNDIKNNNNNGFKRIKVRRKNKKSKCSKQNDKKISNLKRMKPNQNEIKSMDNKINKNNNNLKLGNLNLISIPNISQSIIENEEKKEKRNSCRIKLKNNPNFRPRSSSHKFKSIQKNKNDNQNNIIKIKLPNSEGRKKKYKINIIKRTKIKYKKNKYFSEEKILINNYNKEANENLIKKKRTTKSQKEIEKDNKIILIIKEDLENYILFSMKNEDNKIKYNYSLIGQLLTKEKINLSDLIRYYLKICFDILDEKNKIRTANEYIQNIIEKYKRTYLNNDNFIKIHEDILDILVDKCIEENKSKNRKKENKYKFDIIGALFYSLLINELFFVSDLNMFINYGENVYINIAKIVRYIIIYSNDEKLKNRYFEEFKNCKMFFNNPIYFKYCTKFIKLSNSKNFN